MIGYLILAVCYQQEERVAPVAPSSTDCPVLSSGSLEKYLQIPYKLKYIQCPHLTYYNCSSTSVDVTNLKYLVNLQETYCFRSKFILYMYLAKEACIE